MGFTCSNPEDNKQVLGETDTTDNSNGENNDNNNNSNNSGGNNTGGGSSESIIADHTVVDLYSQIPQQYIDIVKTWLGWRFLAHSRINKGAKKNHRFHRLILQFFI